MLAAFILLTALCLQVLPFTFQQPLPAAAADDGAARYFQPLQVCGDAFPGPSSDLPDAPPFLPDPSLRTHGDRRQAATAFRTTP
jgi:hypothetical protein